MEKQHHGMEPASSPPKTENVFAYLMNQTPGANKNEKIKTQSSSKRKQSTHNSSNNKASPSSSSPFHSQPSRFLVCPYCSKSVTRAFSQIHVETCDANAEYQTQQQLLQERKRAKIFHKHRSTAPSKEVLSPEKNAFTKMMNQSKQWNFGDSKLNNTSDDDIIDNPTKSNNRRAKRQQWFHLTKDMNVLWIADDNTGETTDANPMESKVDALCGEIHWSSSILIHASKIQESNDDNVELHITSSIPTANQIRPFVQQTSRLSIPVLKSILQKNIRRRRPLPSVKVAMELADKRLGELLRRLPIICIEDSTLHHDFPFLVWLMVAHSKKFQPTRPMMTRLFQAIFEIASCPWKDTLDILPTTTSCKDNGKTENEPPDISLTALSQCFGDKHDNVKDDGGGGEKGKRYEEYLRCDLMLRSILLRHKYGGMGCDLRMLQRCAKVWQHRFHHEVIVGSRLATACLPRHCNGAAPQIRWSDVPKLLHPVERSYQAVSPMTSRMLPCLKHADVTPAGVDFHCSNILDVPLHNVNLQSQIQELFGRTGDTSKALSVQEIGEILKTACWEHCSGVNYRRTFRQVLAAPATSKPNSNGTPDNVRDGIVRIKQVWEKVAPSVQKFAKDYLMQRMITPR